MFEGLAATCLCNCVSSCKSKIRLLQLLEEPVVVELRLAAAGELAAEHVPGQHVT